MAQVTINGGGGTYLQTPMYTGLTLGANEYPKGTVTFSLAAGWFFLNAGSSSTTYTYTLYVCDQDGYNAIQLGTFQIKGMSSAVGISFTVSTDKPGLKGKGIYIKTVGDKEPSFIRLNSTATLTMATYTDAYTITASGDAHGILTASKSSAAAGEQITLTPAPEQGYELNKYTVTPSTVTISGNKFTMPAANVTITASFKLKSYSITTSVPAGHGTLTANKATAKMNETVTLTPTPASGYALQSITTDPARTVSGNKFTMPPSDVTVTAVFRKLSYTVTTKAGTGGTLTASKSTAGIGDTITLTPTPASGYDFTGYTTSPQVTITNNTFTMPAANVTITANFTPHQYAITKAVNPTNSGTITTSKSSAAAGEKITLTASPKSGYQLTGYTTDPARTVKDGAFTMPASAVTVTGNFALTSYKVTCKANPTGAGTVTATPATAHKDDTVTLDHIDVSGYDFIGYTTSPQVTISSGGTFTMPAANVTVTANYVRRSTATLSSKQLTGGQSVTLNIDSESEAYSHKYKIEFENVTGMATSLTTVAAGVSQVTISIPAGWSDLIPNAAKVTGGKLTLYTYKNGTQIGSAYTLTGLAYNVPASVKPAVQSIATIRINQYDGHDYSGITGNHYIQDHCKVRTTATVVGARSSTISKVALTMSGYSGSAYKKTVVPVTDVASYSLDFTSGELYLAGATKITMTVTDSRGRSASASANITVEEYSPPGGTLTVNRVDADRIPDEMGTYGIYELTKSYTQIGNNSLTWTLSVSGSTASSPADSGDLLPGSRMIFQQTSEYEVTLTLTDLLETTVIKAKLQTARFIIYVDKTGNKIGFMKKPNKSIPSGMARTFEISADTQVYIGDSTLESFVKGFFIKRLTCLEGTTDLEVADGSRIRLDFITTAGDRTGSALIAVTTNGYVHIMQTSLGAKLALTRGTNTVTVTCTDGATVAYCTVYTGSIALASNT